MKKKEKRAFPRLKAYHLVKYSIISSAKSKTHSSVVASADDVSGGGLRLNVEENIPVSSVIQIYINFPDLRQTLPIVAKVVWTKQIGKTNRYQAGVQFLDEVQFPKDAIIKRIDQVYKKIEDK